jgi:hypothetical protein
MRETRSWEQMRRDNIGAAWIEPSGKFCTRYSRTSTSGEVNALLDEQRAAGLEEWQLVGFNGCWSCDRCIECHFKKQPDAKPQPLIAE